VSGSAFALVQGFGVSPTAYGVLFATVMLGQIAGSWLSTRLVLSRGPGGMLRLGAALLLAAGASAPLAAWSGTMPALVLSLMFFMFSASLTVPNAQAAALTPFPATAGAASSLIGASAFALGATISAVLGAAFDGTAGPMAAVIALAGCAAFGFERWLARPVLAWKA